MSSDIMIKQKKVYLILTEKISNPKTQKAEMENYMYGPCVVR